MSGEVETRQEVSCSSVTPLVPSEEFPEPQDVTFPVQQHDEPTNISESTSLASGTPDAAPLPSPPMGDYMYFPILQDKKTIEYVRKTKVSGLNVLFCF